MAAQKSYTLDSFHKPFYDGSMCNRDVVLSEKLPPDKVKIRLLTTAAYLVTFIICIMIPTTNCNGVPMFWSSTANHVPETSAEIMFQSFAVIQSHSYDVPHLCSSLGCNNDVDEFLLTYGSGGLDIDPWDHSKLGR